MPYYSKQPGKRCSICGCKRTTHGRTNLKVCTGQIMIGIGMNVPCSVRFDAHFFEEPQ